MHPLRDYLRQWSAISMNDCWNAGKMIEKQFPQKESRYERVECATKDLIDGKMCDWTGKVMRFI